MEAQKFEQSKHRHNLYLFGPDHLLLLHGVFEVKLQVLVI